MKYNHRMDPHEGVEMLIGESPSEVLSMLEDRLFWLDRRYRLRGVYWTCQGDAQTGKVYVVLYFRFRKRWRTR
jgi:hypothetical protein